MTIHRIPFTFTSPQGVEAARLAIVDTDKLRGMAYACLNNKTKRSVEAGGALVVTFDDGRRTVEPGLTAGIRPALVGLVAAAREAQALAGDHSEPGCPAITPDPIRAALAILRKPAPVPPPGVKSDTVALLAYRADAIIALVSMIQEAEEILSQSEA